MENKIGSTTFKTSVNDTFPYIESTIIKLDNNLEWWKKNYKELEELVANEVNGIISKPIEIKIRFIIYNGPDENVYNVEWNGPAIEFLFMETSDRFALKVKNKIGTNWKGRRLVTDENKLIILFE